NAAAEAGGDLGGDAGAADIQLVHDEGDLDFGCVADGQHGGLGVDGAGEAVGGAGAVAEGQFLGVVAILEDEDAGVGAGGGGANVQCARAVEVDGAEGS